MPNYADSLTSVRLTMYVTPEVDPDTNNNLQVQSHYINIIADDPTVVESGVAASGSTGTSVVFSSPANTTDDYYNKKRIEITGGTGAGQIRTIVDYVGATKTATVDKAWDVDLDATSTYNILNPANIFVYQKEVNDPQDPKTFIAAFSNVCTPADYNALPEASEPIDENTPTLFRHSEVRHYARSWEELEALKEAIQTDVSQLVNAFANAAKNNTSTTVTYTAT